MRLEAPLVGSMLILKSLDMAAADGTYAEWMTDPEILDSLEARFSEHSPNSLRKFIRDCEENPHVLLLGIHALDSGDHIGNIKLAIQPHHRRGDIGIVIGNKKFWGRGVATEAIRILTQYAFEKLALMKLTASCYANNVRSERAFLNAGFSVEARRPAHFLHRGKAVDGLFLGLLNPAQIP